jgi:16S rRNA (cytosine967-C5)-methyltransferase
MVLHNDEIKLPAAGDGPRMAAWVALRRLMRKTSTGAQDELSAAAEAAKLKPLDVGLAFEMLMGVLRNRRLLDKVLESLEGFEPGAMDEPMCDVLRLGAFQHLLLDRIPPHAVVSEMVDVAKARIGERGGGFANAALQQLLRQYGDDGAALKKLQDTLKPEERYSWPGWAASRW